MLSRLTVEKYIEFSALEQKIKSSLQYSLNSVCLVLKYDNELAKL